MSFSFVSSFHYFYSCKNFYRSCRWEYYSMIYVRSNNSIRLFPRASLALFLLYHFYLFSSPAGFHLLALLVLFLFLTSLMVSTKFFVRTLYVHVYVMMSCWTKVSAIDCLYCMLMMYLWMHVRTYTCVRVSTFKSINENIIVPNTS